MKTVSFFILFHFSCFFLYAQEKVDISYFLDKTTEYNKDIPTPKEVLGYEIGEWHITHDQLVTYVKKIAQLSDRVNIEIHGRTHESRPLILLTITSPKNHQRIEDIKNTHRALSTADTIAYDLPAVIWMGYSIHGDEASGSNAVPLFLYHLAASMDEKMEDILENTVILLDPSYNPDGLQRFSTWVNMHKSINNSIPNYDHREHHQEWPTGRTNHYWFDLNRDWILTQQPETQARVKKFQEWKPLILTDHHEMSYYQTFFFQPGVPSRKNPLINDENVTITNKIANYHRKYLDKIGSMYFSEENFDDFYIGKGSTYPDLQGGIGILFEQASAEGQAIQTPNGILTFPFAIRNHLTTSLSTLAATYELRKELQNYRRIFFQNLKKEIQLTDNKAYVFGESFDKVRLYHFIDILLRHKIEVYRLARDIKIKKNNFKISESYIIPLDQEKHQLIKGLFETQKSFKDSLFYDVSAWTLPLSFHISYGELNKNDFNSSLLGKKVEKAEFPKQTFVKNVKDEDINYGVFRYDGYYAPRAIYRLLRNKIMVKVATKPFQMRINTSREKFTYGTILVPLRNQKMTKEDIMKILNDIVEKDGIKVFGMGTAFTPKGIDLGSSSFSKLKTPKVLLIVGKGVNAYEAGEVWHLFDQRYHIPLTLVQTDRLQSVNINKFNTIVAVKGNYGNVSGTFVNKLKNWIREGNVFIPMSSAVTWANDQEITQLSVKTLENKKNKKYRAYGNHEADKGSSYIGGSIFMADIDTTHPIGYGYRKAEIPVFRNHKIFLYKTKNSYAAPLRYTQDPLISGYISPQNQLLFDKNPIIVVSKLGKGKTISIVDNMNFRAYWQGTNKLFINAVLFGSVIDNDTAE